MALNGAENPKVRTPRHGPREYSLQQTMGSYEVRELSARQAARYLARQRARGALPQSHLPDSVSRD
jgi:hypothetical protein